MPEPFFVKNLERVQGDERDAIILSIGYGKHPDGRMRYQWGPLLRDGGERRLNVAATRAKHRLTVVSSFSSHDVDPDRLTKAGARLLAEYLEYAGSGGTPVAASGAGTPVSTRSRHRSWRPGSPRYGIIVVPQYGVGGYRVDFAAAHPDDPSRMILAVEADGAVLPRLRQRPRPGPAAQGAPGAARLAGPPALVHQLVHRPRRRAGQAPRRLRRSRPRQPPGTPAPAARPARGRAIQRRRAVQLRATAGRGRACAPRRAPARG